MLLFLICYCLLVSKMAYKITAEDERLLAKLSPYQQATLRVLAEVPKGKVTTYGSLAKEVARRHPQYSPKASRAVGTTMKNNVCGPRIPCHRVIKSDGSIGNFRGGSAGAIAEKKQMLQDEGVEIINKKVDLSIFEHHF
jgi:methylated-DNA-[protein]-cysteine S-methyltransferase